MTHEEGGLAVEEQTDRVDVDARMAMTDDVERDGARFGDADALDQVHAAALDVVGWAKRDQRNEVQVGATDRIAS